MSRRSDRRSRYYEDRWPAYVPVAERRRKAELEMAKLRKKGVAVSPVKIEGRVIASTFWGKAWCENLESYHDYANRLDRGRTYVRNGSVVDLQIAPREVTATVSGSALYKVKVSIGDVAGAQWKSICADCAGGIDSLVELLQGRFSKGVMERICRQGAGLFPKPSEIRFSCSCPDYASMCKHVAAVLYGVGARLDASPELLFRLRAVNENDLVADIGDALPMSKQGPAAGKVLEADDMAALFGLDMAGSDEPVEVSPEPPAPKVAGRSRAAAGKAMLNGVSEAKPGSAAAKPGGSKPKDVRAKVAIAEYKPPAGQDAVVAVSRTGGRNGKVAALSREKPDVAAQQPDSLRVKATTRKAVAPKRIAPPDAGSIDPAKLQQLVAAISGGLPPALPRQVAKPKGLARRPAPPQRNVKALAVP